MAHRLPVLTLLIAITILAGCGASSTEPDQNTPEPIVPPQTPTFTVPSFEAPSQSYDDRSMHGVYYGYTEAQLDEIARMPMALFSIFYLLSDGGEQLASALRQRNPNIILLGNIQMLSIPEYWGMEYFYSRYPMALDMYNILIDHTFETSEGEPVLMWAQARMINPMAGNVIDSGLMNRLVDTICKHALLHPGTIDGVSYDYMSTRPWAYPAGDASFNGYLDLDGDTIPFDEDSDESNAWVGWQRSLPQTLQSRFGEGFVQIANGKLPLVDPTVAQQLAGVIFEGFPTLVWNYTQQEGLETAMQMRQTGWLTPRRGQYWNVYWSESWEHNGNLGFRRMASYLTGDLYEVNTTREEAFVGVDSMRTVLGAPTGDFQRTFDNGAVIYSRAFEQGSIRMEFNSNGRLTSSQIQN